MGEKGEGARSLFHAGETIFKGTCWCPLLVVGGAGSVLPGEKRGLARKEKKGKELRCSR